MIGTYEHSIDGKGRLIIPSRLKEELGDCFHIGPGFDRYLTIYPAAAWETVCQRAQELEDEEELDTMEAFFSQCFPCTVDSQNRIVIPPFLREKAGLEKDVAIVGANTVARIWDAATWNKKMSAELAPERLKSVARKVRL